LGYNEESRKLAHHWILVFMANMMIKVTTLAFVSYSSFCKCLLFIFPIFAVEIDVSVVAAL